MLPQRLRHLVYVYCRVCCTILNFIYAMREGWKTKRRLTEGLVAWIWCALHVTPHNHLVNGSIATRQRGPSCKPGYCQLSITLMVTPASKCQRSMHYTVSINSACVLFWHGYLGWDCCNRPPRSLIWAGALMHECIRRSDRQVTGHTNFITWRIAYITSHSTPYNASARQ